MSSKIRASTLQEEKEVVVDPDSGRRYYKGKFLGKVSGMQPICWAKLTYYFMFYLLSFDWKGRLCSLLRTDRREDEGCVRRKDRAKESFSQATSTREG